MPTIVETIAFIMKAHEGQKDACGAEYWFHPVAVLSLLPPEVSEDACHAALLHDVLEDTTVTEDILREEGYSERTIALVKGLSREHPTTYRQHVVTVAASGDKELILLKLADSTHNSDLGRAERCPDPSTRIKLEQMAKNRYAWGKKILEAALRGLE